MNIDINSGREFCISDLEGAIYSLSSFANRVKINLFDYGHDWDSAERAKLYRIEIEKVLSDMIHLRQELRMEYGRLSNEQDENARQCLQLSKSLYINRPVGVIIEPFCINR